MKGTINKGIANPHTQHQRIANPLERATAYYGIPILISQDSVHLWDL